MIWRRATARCEERGRQRGRDEPDGGRDAEVERGHREAHGAHRVIEGQPRPHLNARAQLRLAAKSEYRVKLPENKDGDKPLLQDS